MLGQLWTPPRWIRRRAARWRYYTASKANGTPLTGVDYAFQYNRTLRRQDVRRRVMLEHPDRHARCRQDERLRIHRRANCGSTGGQHGEATCAVNFASVDYTNWDAFAAAVVSDCNARRSADTTEPERR